MNKIPPPTKRFFQTLGVLILLLSAVGVFLLSRQQSRFPGDKGTGGERDLPGFPLNHEGLERVPVRLFFPDRALRLVPEDHHEIYRTPDVSDRLRQVLLLLLRGFHGEGRFPAFPGSVGLRELYLYKGCAYVDLSIPGTVKSHDGCLMESLSVDSIRMSVIRNFPTVDSVRILVNGRESETLFGHIDIRNPFGDRNQGGMLESSDRNL